MIERMERALVLLAYFIELDGDVHVPMYEKFEAELRDLKRKEDTRARAEPFAFLQRDIQLVATLFNTTISLALFGAILSVMNQMRQNANERLQLRDEQIKNIKEAVETNEGWHKREKDMLTDELDRLKSALEKQAGTTTDVDLVSLALGSRRGANRVTWRLGPLTRSW
jgi:hypothetical protein